MDSASEATGAKIGTALSTNAETTATLNIIAEGAKLFICKGQTRQV
jgi:hypothetical protein